MSSISLIRRSGDPQIYADIQDDGRRDAWYQPVSPEAIAALGLSDKNVRFAGNVNKSLIRGGTLTADSIKSLAQQMLSSAKSNNAGVGNLQDLVSGNAPAAFGTHETNFDPVSDAQKAKDDSVKAQMQKQNEEQLAASAKADAETAAKNAEAAAKPPAAEPTAPPAATPAAAKTPAETKPTPGSSAKTLYDFFKQQGQSLPPLAERAKLFESAKLGAGVQYKGTAEQNNKLLEFLKTKSSTPSLTDQYAPEADTGKVQVMLPGNGPIESRLLTVDPTSPLVSAYGVYDGATDQSASMSGGTTSGGGSAPASVNNGSGGGYGSDMSSPAAIGGTEQSLPPAWEAALSSLKDYVDLMQQQGQMIAPDLTVTQDEVNKFIEQAKTDLSPYHSQLISRAQSDVTNMLQYQAAEQKALRTGQDVANVINQENQAATMAERGLADSGIREQAKQRLEQQYTGLVESTKRKFQQDVTETGKKAERYLGSANMPNLAGIPSVEGIGFNPVGGQTGSLESQNQADVLGRAADIAKSTRAEEARQKILSGIAY